MFWSKDRMKTYNIMKKLVLICFTIIAGFAFGNAQQNNWSEDAKEQLKGKGKRMSVEDRAKRQTQEMKKSLNLSAAQERQVEKVLLGFHQKMGSKRQARNKSYQEMSDSERQEMKSEQLVAQKALSKEMEKILDEEQFATFSEKMGDWQRQARKRRRQGKS